VRTIAKQPTQEGQSTTVTVKPDFRVKRIPPGANVMNCIYDLVSCRSCNLQVMSDVQL